MTAAPSARRWRASSNVRGLETLQRDYRNDPVGFNANVLERPAYWSGQRDICRSLVRYRITVVYSGNAVGKDYVIAGIVPWWGLTRPGSLCIVTGVSQTLLGSVTWKEIRSAVQGSALMRELGVKVSSGVKTSPQTVTYAQGWHALGFSTTNVERASGQHAGELLAIINEGSGVDDAIYDAVDSWNYRRLLVTGNPLRPDGRMVELIRRAAEDARDGIPPEQAINAIRIPSTDSPHAHLEHSPVGLADRTWLDTMVRRYGPDSNWVRSHIAAEIPTVREDTLLPGPWLDWCAAHSRPILPAGHPIASTRRIGCDLGEGVGRDSSAIIVRDDWGILDCVFGEALGLAEAAEAVRRLAVQWEVPPDRITFDRVGIGKDFPLYLARVGLAGAVPYAGAGKASMPDGFINLRSEAYWRFRRRIDPGYYADQGDVKPRFLVPRGPYWPRLREELAVLTYRTVGKRTAVMRKEDHAIILGHSPDLADALAQTFAFP